jgi:hypothetical protein
VDQLTWGQVDSDSARGGWRYGWNNNEADNSACQWSAMSLIAAGEHFGLKVPAFVKSENRIWLSNSFDGNHYGYSARGD